MFELEMSWTSRPVKIVRILKENIQGMLLTP